MSTAFEARLGREAARETYSIVTDLVPLLAEEERRIPTLRARFDAAIAVLNAQAGVKQFVGALGEDSRVAEAMSSADAMVFQQAHVCRVRYMAALCRAWSLQDRLGLPRTHKAVWAAERAAEVERERIRRGEQA